MKKLFSLSMILILCVAICACGPAQLPEDSKRASAPSPAATTPSTQSTVPSTEHQIQPTNPATQPTQPPAPTEPEVPTDPPAPLHSELYLPDVSQEQLLEYFCEVVLATEYSTGSGDATLVQKWTEELTVGIIGEPTQQDLEVLEALFAELNAMEGFPGIRYAQEEEYYNVTMYFLEQEAFDDQFMDFLHGEVADGAVQYWYYLADNAIHTARIGYRTDISQQIRNSVLIEEVINGLGLNDTILREDSILYQYGSETTELSEVDWVILRLLYNPAVRGGMNAEECAEVIRQLYY